MSSAQACEWFVASGCSPAAGWPRQLVVGVPKAQEVSGDSASTKDLLRLRRPDKRVVRATRKMGL